MKTAGRILAALLLMASVMVVGASSASADNQYHCGTNCDGCAVWTPSPHPPTPCPDGYWFVRGAYYLGGPCYSQGNWSQLAACTNQDFEIVNNGYACGGCDHINIYYAYNYQGAWACESLGDYWDNGSGPVAKVYFDHGAGKAGYGQTVWYNAASIKWVGSC